MPLPPKMKVSLTFVSLELHLSMTFIVHYLDFLMDVSSVPVQQTIFLVLIFAKNRTLVSFEVLIILNLSAFFLYCHMVPVFKM